MCRFLLFFLGLGFSQTIILKSGQKVEGTIVEQTDKYVKLEFQGVQLVYYNDEITSIDQASPASVNAITTQVESLYKAYTSALNAPKQPKEEEEEEIVAPVKQELIKTDQTSPASQAAPVNTSTPDLSRLPPEYQKMIKTTLANLQASGSEQAEEKE